VKYFTKDSLGGCFQFARTKQWLGRVLALLLAIGMLQIVSAAMTNTPELVSVNKDGTDSGSSLSQSSSISADGRFVAFQSVADNLVATDTNDESDVFVRDLQSDTTTLISVNKDGTGSGNDESL
jgi:hypothetical protein